MGVDMTPPAPVEGNVIQSAFRLENSVVNGLEWLAREPYDYDPTHDPLDVIRGTKYEDQHLSRFVQSWNEQNTRDIMARIDREEHDRAVLMQAGAGGMLAAMLAGTADPTVLVPLGGWLTPIAKGGRAATIAIRAAEGAAVVGGSVLAQEAALQANQELRTAGESIGAVAAGTLLGALLGAGAGALTRPEAQAAGEQLFGSMPGTRAEEAAMFDEAVQATTSAGAAVTAEARGSGELKSAFGLEKKLAWQDPLFRTSASFMPTVRNVVRDLAELPTTLAENSRGIATSAGGAVETEAKKWTADLGQFVQEYDKAWFAYYKRMAGKGRISGMVAKGRGNVPAGLDGLTFQEFKLQVSRAAREGQVSDVPEIKQAADAYRRLDDKLRQAAIDAKMFDENVHTTDDISHVFRAYDQEAITARRSEFEDRLVKRAQSLQARAVSAVEGLSKKLEERQFEVDQSRARVDDELARFKERQAELRAAQRAGKAEARHAGKELKAAQKGYEKAVRASDRARTRLYRELLADLKRGRPAGAKAGDLVSFIKSKGGIRLARADVVGREQFSTSRSAEIRDVVGKSRGIIKSDGLDPDAMLRLAQDEGYIPPTGGLDDLVEGIDLTLKGNPVFSSFDDALIAETQNLQRIRGELEQRGFDLDKMKPDDLARAMQDRTETGPSGGLKAFHGGAPGIKTFDPAAIGSGEGISSRGIGHYFYDASFGEDVAKRRATNHAETFANGGETYAVTIDATPADFIDVDALRRGEPLENQPPRVQAALKEMLTGDRTIDDIVVDPAAVDALRQKGIAGTRGGGELVVFPGNEQLIHIGQQGGGVLAQPDAALRKWIGGSAVTNPDGTPMVVYHGTTTDVSSFKEGTHFGTATAANERLLEKVGLDETGQPVAGKTETPNIVPVYLKIENPVRMPDLGEWTPDNFADEFADMGFDPDLVDAVRSGERDPIDVLREKGYDGIEYVNDAEDYGSTSWIIFSPDQVKSAIGGVETPPGRRIERPIEVWHGTPHLFDKFESGFTGKGTGYADQAAGLYFSTDRSFSEMFGNAAAFEFNDPKIEVDGVPVTARRFAEMKGVEAGSEEALRNQMAWFVKDAKRAPIQGDADYFRNAGDPTFADYIEANLGKVTFRDVFNYRTRLHAAPEEFLNFDATVGDLSATERQKLGVSAGEDPSTPVSSYVQDNEKVLADKFAGVVFGEDQGAANYVVFPGNEDLIEIVEIRNRAGESVKGGAGRGAIDDLVAGAPQVAPRASSALQRALTDIEDLARRFDEATLTAEDVARVAAELEDMAPDLVQMSRASREAVQGARREIIDLQRSIAAQDEFANLTREELLAIAQETTNKILGTDPRRLTSYGDLVSGKRGPLKERILRIPTHEIEDFVKNDPEELARLSIRTMAPDIALKRKFGDIEMAGEIARINDEASALSRAAKTSKERTRIGNEAKERIKDILHMRDRIRGVAGIPENPNSLIVRSARVVRNLNYVRLLGGMTLSALPDPMRVAMTYGPARAFGAPLRALMRNSHVYKGAAKEAKLAGTAWDMILDTRAMIMADVFDDFATGGSAFERGLVGATRKFGLVSLMAPWNATLKQFAGVVAQTKLFDLVQKVTHGRASKADLEFLGQGSIDPHMARRIWDQFQAHGQTEDGVRFANTEAWTDPVARESFRSFLVREIDRVIVTPGQDRPKWMDSETGKLIGQFRSFGVASVQRTLIAGLQQRDAAALNGAMLMIAMGMMSYAAKQGFAGRDLSDDPRVWLTEGIDRSGVLAWFADINGIAEKMTGGRVGMSAITGETASRFASRGTIGALIGPTAGAVTDFAAFTRAVATGEVSASDVSGVRRLLPAQNLFYLRWLFDQVEAASANALGAEAA